METNRSFGLIGHPLSHSFSKEFFSEKFKTENISATYENFDLERISDFPALLHKRPDLKGLNVTIPYKEDILEYVNHLSEEAKEIGAVNTLKIDESGIIGHNTDWLGFKMMVENTVSYYGEKALILGSGGASKAIKYALNKLDIKSKVVSRSGSYDFNYKDVNKEVINENRIIINTTPLGTFPDINVSPDLPFSKINKSHFIIDLIYNPEKTLLLKKSEEQGARIMNGYQMLKNQAELSWKFWNL